NGLLFAQEPARWGVAMRLHLINLLSLPVALGGCLAESAAKPPATGGPPTMTTKDLGASRDLGNSSPNGDLGQARDGNTGDCQPSWTVTPLCGGGNGSGVPDFGPNVIIFDPSQALPTIQGKIDSIYSQQDGAQFGSGRYAVLFKPGNYNL